MSVNPTVWSSRFGFLMASIGFAVGLGNIWRFPYIVGENGGSIFIVIYLCCVFFIGVPILMAEIMLGRRGAASPEQAIKKVAEESSCSPRWSAVGYLNLLTSFLIVFVYSVVAGWVLYYFYQSLMAGFSGTNLLDQLGSFEDLQSDVRTMVFWSFAALAITGSILVFGVQKGIERAVVALIPAMVVLLVFLVFFNLLNGGMQEALEFMFIPDFSVINGSVFLAAVSQAFFSIGVAMGGMMIFGSYLPSNISIAKSALIIVSADTLIALLAGLVIFPLVFENGLMPDSGTGLIFNTLPFGFAQMPAGYWIAVLFFMLLGFAAISSMVGFIEPLVAFLINRFDLSRLSATLLVTAICLCFSALSAFSMGPWNGLELSGRSLAGWLDFVPNSVFLPLGGLMICVFAGWAMNPKFSQAELNMKSSHAFHLWKISMKWLVAPAVFIILIAGVFP